MTEVAYTAEVELHEAKWTDKDGSTVTFKLPMAGMEGQRNPFERWTKRRKGHAGTRFMMACHGDGHTLVYADEVMLAGWNDSQTTGHTVKLWLAMDQMGHPFEGYERHKDKFTISLAEIDDDQEIIDQKVRERVESASKRPSERTSYVAAMLCKNEGFWTWLTETRNVAVNSEEDARIVMLDMLGLPSRGILDKNEYQAKRFHERLRKPFVEWQGEY
jgi:hypothetical protein